MQIGKREFDFRKGHTYVMGILNVTPDSFSDGGSFQTIDKALFHAEEMIRQGADLIDVGGESTRPGYIQVSAGEEIDRITSVIGRLKKEFDIPVSADTYKAPVMDAALSAGADLANDIWGLRYDVLFADGKDYSGWGGGTMAEVIAKHKKPVCIMQNRRKAEYENLIEEICSDLQESIRIGERAGIDREQMILDPGIGFGKTYGHNLEILAKLECFLPLGFPLLLAASRKSVIGMTLDLPVGEREEGTLMTTALAVCAHWDIVRVHDVEKNVRAIKMLEKIREYAG